MSTTSTASVQTAFLSSAVYDRIKWVAQYGLPALGTLYFALASIWGLPAAEQVLGTITALDVFLGVVLGLSARSYNASDAKYDGEVIVTGNPTQPHTLTFNVPLSQMESQTEIVLKVVPPTP